MLSVDVSDQIQKDCEGMLGIGCPLDGVVEMIWQRSPQTPSDLPEAFDCAVVHPKIRPALERMTVVFADAHSGRGRAHVSEEAGRRDVFRKPLQVLVVPRRSETSKDARSWADFRCVPADAKAVTIKRLFAFLRLIALQDQRVLRTVKQVREKNLWPYVAKKPTHRIHSVFDCARSA